MTEPLATRKLGNTGLTLSVLGMGTWGLCAESYGKVLPELRARTLSSAIDQGLSVFDMAPLWGRDGASEREVKEAVGQRRDAMTYITRTGVAVSESGVELKFDAAFLRSQCEG